MPYYKKDVKNTPKIKKYYRAQKHERGSPSLLRKSYEKPFSPKSAGKAIESGAQKSSNNSQTARQPEAIYHGSIRFALIRKDPSK